MVPFEELCPQLGTDETRSLIVPDSANLPGDQYSFFESYCINRNCDCRRVLFTVVSQTHLEEEAVISFGLERDDPFRGPFLDPLFNQGPHANEILDLLSNLLKRDAVYVGRLERHYEIAKAISSGTLKPENAKPSFRLPDPANFERIGQVLRNDRPNSVEALKLSNTDLRECEPTRMFKSLIEMGQLAGFDMTTVEGIESFAEEMADKGLFDKPSVRPPFGFGGTTSRRPDRDAKKRQRQNKKRNRR